MFSLWCIPITTIVVLLSVYLYYLKKFKFWAKIGIPHTTPTIPFGDFQGISSKKCFGECITKIYNDHKEKKYVGYWTLFQPNLLIRDPGIIKDITVRDFMSFHDRGINVNEDVDPLAGHLFSIGGAKWRNIRVKLTPTFTSGKMKFMLPIVIQCSNLLQTAMDTYSVNGEVDVKEVCACFTTDVISLCAFGVKANSLINPLADFRQYGKKLIEPNLTNTVRGLCALMFPGLHKFLKMRATDKNSSDFFIKTFRDSISFREQNNAKGNDFLGLLMQLLEKGKLDDADNKTESKPFTLDEAVAQAFAFFFAGFETSSTTMQFALYELAKNHDLQNECRKEIKVMLEKTNDEITYDIAVQNDLLSRVINETLRKYPPIPFLQRQCNKDYTISNTNHVIPKGTIINIDVLGLHRDEKYYPNPELFDPDRFLDEEKRNRHNFVYLPFGEGPRNCIGMRFGQMQSKVGLMTLLKNYSFDVTEKTPIPLILDKKSFILTPKGEMILKINPLN